MPWREELLVRVASAVIALVVFALVISHGHAATTFPAEVAVVDERCVDGNVTALRIAVGYHGDRPVTVTPHVWSSQQHVQFSWTPQAIRLDPGENFVTISAPDERAYLAGDRAQVYLADGQRRAITNWEIDRCT